MDLQMVGTTVRRGRPYPHPEKIGRIRKTQSRLMTIRLTIFKTGA
jgi:hypothetical protein